MGQQKFKGKVIYAGPVKKFKKGYSMGFKIEGFDDFLNIQNNNEFQATIKKGDMVEGNFIPKTSEFPYNEVKGFEVTKSTNIGTSLGGSGSYGFVPTPEVKLVPAFKTAAEIQPIDNAVDENMLLMDKCYVAFANSTIAQDLKDLPEVKEKYIVSLFMACRADQGKSRW